MPGPVSLVPPVAMESPCVGVCALDADTRYCTGCFRTIAEITDWTRGSADWRQRVMAALPERRATLAAGQSFASDDR
jgi:predicted Fe-S protein YdhL (DUF1289 family)